MFFVLFVADLWEDFVDILVLELMMVYDFGYIGLAFEIFFIS